MMRFRTIASLHLLPICLVFAGAAGCSIGGSTQEALFEVEVHIDGHPVADIQVALAPMETAEPILTGITNRSGVAGMMMVNGNVPNADVTEYRVVVESLGDFQLTPPWTDPKKSPLALSWPASEQKLLIELPKKAVRKL